LHKIVYNKKFLTDCKNTVYFSSEFRSSNFKSIKICLSYAANQFEKHNFEKRVYSFE